MVGVDIVQISGFQELFELPGTRFADNFTPQELQDSANGETDIANISIESLAGKWAAKEAFIKAWSGIILGEPPKIHRDLVVMSEIEILKDAWGRPYIKLHGTVRQKYLETVSSLLIDGVKSDVKLISVTISHDGDIAMAVVQI